MTILNAPQFIAATFSSYEKAHAGVQNLYDAGYGKFTVTYIQGRSDQAADGIDGFYPNTTPFEQVAVDHPADEMAEQEVPQIAALSTTGNRTTPDMKERLAMIGIPQEYRDFYATTIVGGQVLAVIRGQENVPAMMSELSVYAASIRTFSS